MTSTASPAHNVRLVLTTCGEAEAAELARRLLEERLVACVSAFPVVSRYRWDGKLQEDREVQLLLKTSRENLQPLLDDLARTHPYALPEQLVLQADAVGHYGAWLQADAG